MFGGMAGFIAVGITIAICVAGDRAAKKRKRVFRDRYGSFEGFRSQVDPERIRGVRRRSGDVAPLRLSRDGEALRGRTACLRTGVAVGRTSVPVSVTVLVPVTVLAIGPADRRDNRSGG
jgi:hypothetical protein